MHVNADWLARTAIPADRVSYDAFAEVAGKVEADVHAIIRDVSSRRDAASAEARKMADLYASVTDEATIEARGRAPLEPQLARIARIRNGRDLAREIGRQRAQQFDHRFQMERAAGRHDRRHWPVTAQASDWVIDMGPGAGDEGGQVVAAGAPRDVARSARSRTAPYLARALDAA